LGATASFVAEARGSASLTYQWQKGGIDIPGATGPALTIANVQLSDAGSYTVIATNNGGAATSTAVLLTTFIAPPSNAVITFTIQ